MPSTKRLLLALVLASSTSSSSHAQTISQDYARYAASLNQERADAARRDQQAMYDQSARNSRTGISGSNISGGTGSGSSNSGSNNGGADSIGMLNGTLSGIVARHNAAAAARNNAKFLTREQYLAKANADADRMQQKIDDQKLKEYVEATKKKFASGDIQGPFEMGLLLHDGKGMKQNMPLGLEMITVSAERGYWRAMSLLAARYRDGKDGYPIDLEKSHYWYVKYADLDVAFAAYEVCMNYIVGQGVQQNLKQALAWCTKAADKGDMDGMERLGDLLSGEVAQIPADIPRAMKLYQAAIAKGSDTSQERLSRLLLRAKEGSPDYAQLFPIYEAGARKNDYVAMTNLGLLYLNGNGVEKDTSKANYWLSIAAGNGSARAFYELGNISYNRNLLPEDRTDAVDFWKKAAVRGWPAALYTMGVRTVSGDGVPKDQAEGVRLLEIAASKGDADAPLVLGRMYLDGNGVPKDPAAARKYFDLCSARGNAACAEALKKIN